MIEDMQVKSPGDQGPGGPWYQYIVERREDGVMVGDLGAGFGVPGERQVELGYRIHPAFHRRGYAREAAAALISHLIARHEIHRFVGIAASANRARSRPCAASASATKAISGRASGATANGSTTIISLCLQATGPAEPYPDRRGGQAGAL
jgi:hypothetical protein